MAPAPVKAPVTAEEEEKEKKEEHKDIQTKKPPNDGG